MIIELSLKKSLEENASDYFENAKKMRKKAEGAREAVNKYRHRLENLEHEKVPEKKQVVKKKKKPEWYEKFRWFVSSDSLLVIGGRDATTNELVIKKHTEKNDLVFHTDMAGSPFVVVKAKTGIPEKTRQEAAILTAVFSRAWKKGMATTDVFYVKPEQVSKQAAPGEYLPKGAFMIRGDTEYYHPRMEYAVGIYKNRPMGGPVSAVKKHCKAFVELEQGNEKLSNIAKAIKKKLGGELDDILRVLPPGSKIKK